MSNKKLLLLLTGLTVIALLVAGGLYWRFGLREKPIQTTEEAIKALTESPISNIIPNNPLENKVPDLNPVEKTNPFKNSYTNPFAP